MRFLGSILISSMMATGLVASAGAAGIEDMPPEYTSDPGLIFPLLANLGNARTQEHMAMDVYQHPILMIATFGRLTPAMSLLEVLPATGTYWTEYVGLRLSKKNGARFIQVADPSDKKTWDELNTLKDFLAVQYKNQYEVLPLNLDSLAQPSSMDMVLMQRKMAVLMRAGSLDKLVAAAYKTLKPGGTFLVEDYCALNDKPQDLKAASGYIREDYAIATIQKAGFKLADREDKLFANPNDPRTEAQPNGDRFLLKFTK